MSETWEQQLLQLNIHTVKGKFGTDLIEVCDKNCSMYSFVDKEQQQLTEEGSEPIVRCLKHFDYIV